MCSTQICKVDVYNLLGSRNFSSEPYGNTKFRYGMKTNSLISLYRRLTLSTQKSKIDVCNLFEKHNFSLKPYGNTNSQTGTKTNNIIFLFRNSRKALIYISWPKKCTKKCIMLSSFLLYLMKNYIF